MLTLTGWRALDQAQLYFTRGKDLTWFEQYYSAIESMYLQALETRILKTIAKKGDSIKLKPVSAQKVSAHKSHQSPTK